MPKISCALEYGGKERLTVFWQGVWKNTTVSLDGKVLGVFADTQELKAGKTLDLGDGTILQVKLIQKLYKTELLILRDGKPLPGSANDPVTRYKLAYGIIYFIGGFCIVLGFLSLFIQSRFLQELGIGIFSIIFGTLFISLGFYVKRQSVPALILAISIFLIDSILNLVNTVVVGRIPNTTSIVGRIFLLIPMIQGVKAIRQLPPDA